MNDDHQTVEEEDAPPEARTFDDKLHHPGVEVAAALAKSTSRVSRWLTAETAACRHDRAEASLIEDLVANLLKHQQPIARH